MIRKKNKKKKKMRTIRPLHIFVKNDSRYTQTGKQNRKTDKQSHDKTNTSRNK